MINHIVKDLKITDKLDKLSSQKQENMKIFKNSEGIKLNFIVQVIFMAVSYNTNKIK